MNPYAPPQQPAASNRRMSTHGPRASGYLKGARGTLTILGAILLMLGMFQFMTAEENASRLMTQYARSASEFSSDYDADAWQEAIAQASMPLKCEAGVVIILGAAFLLGGWLVFRAPLTSTIGGLVLFIGLLLFSAINNPASLRSGVVIKIVIISGLIYSIKEAAQFHKAKQRFQEAPNRH